MKETALKSLACVLLLALASFPTGNATAQVTRTDWQMNLGKGVIPLMPDKKLDPAKGHGAVEAYAYAAIPSKDDPNWVRPPNPETIGFGGSTASEINKATCPTADGGSKKCGCWEAVDYTYFQTFVTVPEGTKVDDFRISFSGMDDGSRVSLFDERGAETLIEGSYVRLGGDGTTNLAGYVQQPGTYRVVITQVDDCPVGNKLQSAKVALNHKAVPNTAPAPPSTPIVPASHGDVHISTPDGLIFDFQAAGEFYLTVSDYRTSSEPYVNVQTRQEMWDKNPKVSVNTAAAMMVGGDKVEFYVKPERAFYINGEKTALPSDGLALPKGGSISPTFYNSRNDFTIMWPDRSFGVRVVLFGDSHLNIGTQSFKDKGRKYEGITGNLDGNPHNDFVVQGTSIRPPVRGANLKDFGDTWRIPAGKSLFRGGNTTPATPERQLTLLDLDEEERAEAEQTCQKAGITDPLALGNCTYDVAQTGDEAFVASAKVFEEAIEAAPRPARVAGDAAAEAVLAGSYLGLWKHEDKTGSKPLVLSIERREDGTLHARYMGRPSFSYRPVIDHVEIADDHIVLHFVLETWDKGKKSDYTIQYQLSRQGDTLEGTYSKSWEEPMQVILGRATSKDYE